MDKKEVTFEWTCYYCGAYIGEYPTGVRITCPVCKVEQIAGGGDFHTKEKWDEVYGKYLGITGNK